MTYRVGIVGSSFGGRVHVPAYALHPLFEPIAIASPNNAHKVAADRKLPNAYPSLEEMLDAVGSQIDVVSIATPPFQHQHDVMTAVTAGKHVICEKPVGISLKAVEGMAAAVDKAGVVGAVMFEYRYGSAAQAMRRIIAGGDLPLLRQIEVTRLGTELRRETKRPPSGWWFDKTKGGGLGNAFMPHIVDLALWLCGRPQSACGFMRIANPTRTAPDGSTYPSSVSDGCFAVADLGNGIAARMTADSTAYLEQSTITVRAEGRAMVATGAALTDLALAMHDGDKVAAVDLAPHKYAEYANAGPAIPHVLALLDDFAEALAGKASNVPTFADGLAVQRVLHAIGYEA